MRAALKATKVEEPDLIRRVPADVAKRYGVVPVVVDEQGLMLAMADPGNLLVLDELRTVLGCEVTGVAMDPAELAGLVDRFYGQGAQTVQSVLDDLGDGVEFVRGEDEDGSSGAGLTSAPGHPEPGLSADVQLANDAPVVKLVNSMIVEALQQGASDIHIEPFETTLRVRYRIDGLLYDVTPPPKRLFWAIASRVKIIAGLNIAEKRLPQDGRIRLRMMGRDIDIRVSTVPTMHGESIVLRLLDRSQIRLGLPELGFAARTLREFQRLIGRTNGIILVTGPTGSGKTTTLYAALHAINSADKKIITIEDPVEYQLHGVNQMQVKEKIGFTFSNGLRHILRQDPDIIMVGEIRDEDTARMAIQAALTGHLVFSTLHTNDAASAVTRLADMGVEPFLVTSTVRGMLAQRLVRVLCSHCREAYVPEASELTRAGLALQRGQVVYRAVGCEGCGHTGFRGRTAIYELIPMTPELGRLVLEHASSDEIRGLAVERGLVTLRDDGLRKVVEGVTSLAEVLRVTES